MKKEVLIVGGGFSGLAAAVELVSRGHRVTLLERKPRLGGRAASFKDPVTGSVVDNGQHLLMGCYRDTLEFLEKIGSMRHLRFQKDLRVPFVGPELTQATFRALHLPAPWHLLAGFLFFGGCSLADRLRVLRMRKVVSANGSLDGQSVSEWLRRLGQSERMCHHFWDPLALAALNDRPERSSAKLYQAVLHEALFSGRRGSCLVFPRVGLSELYAEPARAFIERHGGHVITQARVMRLHFQGRRFQEVEMEEGRRMTAETLLVTVPFGQLKRLLPDFMVYQDPFFSSLHRLENSPIVAINLWFDREISQADFIGFWGTRIQWLFNKGRLLGGKPYVSLVVSGAREELKTPGPKLISLALEELRALLPDVRGARLIHSLVMKEPEATMAPSIGVSRWRLPQKTPYQGLFLAGDWTETGLPATIESAVRSAKKAVELIEAEG